MLLSVDAWTPTRMIVLACFLWN